MSESIDKLPPDVADRKVFWAGSILLARALEQGKATTKINELDIEVEIIKMQGEPNE